jgi:hypothetical protein
MRQKIIVLYISELSEMKEMKKDDEYPYLRN